jgi:hypothetical protein
MVTRQHLEGETMTVYDENTALTVFALVIGLSLALHMIVRFLVKMVFAWKR